MKLHTLKLTTEEVFEVVNILSLHLADGDKDIKNAYIKFTEVEMPKVKHNLDYEIPEFKPKERK